MSNYKSHNIVKYLIDITPQGSISFGHRTWSMRTRLRTMMMSLILNQVYLLEDDTIEFGGLDIGQG